MKYIAVHQEINCVTVTLNRPEVANALSAEMVDELTAAVAEAEADGVAEDGGATVEGGGAACQSDADCVPAE